MKINKTFVKLLIMSLVGFIFTTIKEAGEFNTTYVLFTSAFFTIGYLLKNWLFPSLSEKGKLETRDLLSGLYMALNMAAADFGAQILVIGSLDWKMLWLSMSGAALGYFAKTIKSGNIKE